MAPALSITSAEQFSLRGVEFSAPVLMIESGDSGFAGKALMRPPVPVIAIGDRSGVAAKWADVVVAESGEATAMIGKIAANPLAAQVTVQLLRLLPQLSLHDGLVAESLAYGLLQGSGEHAHWLANRPGTPPGSIAGAVNLERHDGRLVITMNRPDSDNAIDQPIRDGLAEAFHLSALDETITKVSLRGAGRSFSLGADLAEFGTTRDPATAHWIRSRTLPAIWAARCADKLEAHVQGACVGAGLEIAAFSRRLTANKRAWFQLPELAMGLLPGAGGCVSLVRRVGRQRTAELILSGKRLRAREALEWGLVDAIVN